MSFNLMQSLSELPLKWKWHIVHFEAADNACPETEFPGNIFDNHPIYARTK